MKVTLTEFVRGLALALLVTVSVLIGIWLLGDGRLQKRG